MAHTSATEIPGGAPLPEATARLMPDASPIGGSGPCLLPGALIDTPFGPVAIETLRPGDLVTVVEGGRRRSRPVRRVEGGRLQPARDIDPARACAVRIRRHAFADGVPSRDLLVTAEQGLHVEGRLIPARMLVNGGSIVPDAGLADNAFVGLDLDRPAILLVEGLEVENGRDAVHRSDGVTPFCVDPAIVEPIRDRLTARSHRLAACAPTLDGLPRTAGGVVIRPALRDGDLYAFVVPAHPTGVRLLPSRSGDTVESFADDRALGVCIGRIGMENEGGQALCTTRLDEVASSGRHAMVHDAAGRWTTSDAVLAIGSACEPASVNVEVTVAGSRVEHAA